ncbi:serine/threonine protein kinase [Alteribacter lacisalsi]|uniref:non-specific serine/threonine protein kinase n=1 Tax=Alteribacter lacisalsi TaxID=2045244 RepID=A0A2W0H2I6_9BACI|nr:protein kinase family protein [Alteribacter lacisalsi]PYZ95417.1 serine/threonine protein kinase [Alteribacter lacisalsi]
MRDPVSKKQACSLSPGETVIGRWHGNRYSIVKELGRGATGTVFLVRSEKGLAALKAGSDAMSITSEVNVLQHFSKVQGEYLGPSLFDVDDFTVKEGTYPFYVMEYIEGEEVIPLLRNKGEEWAGILAVQLLGDLDRLHQAGWIFGDLKPENLLITGPPIRVRWFDVGGTTRTGRAIKEFTEFFDRGYWGLGGRKADPGYDLFAVAMILINSAYPSRFERAGNDNLALLIKKVAEKPSLIRFERIINRALTGQYREAMEMRRDLMEEIGSSSGSKRREPPQRMPAFIRSSPSASLPAAPTRKAHKKERRTLRKRSSGLIETVLVAAFLLLGYALYLFVQIM